MRNLTFACHMGSIALLIVVNPTNNMASMCANGALMYTCCFFLALQTNYDWNYNDSLKVDNNQISNPITINSTSINFDYYPASCIVQNFDH